MFNPLAKEAVPEAKLFLPTLNDPLRLLFVSVKSWPVDTPAVLDSPPALNVAKI